MSQHIPIVNISLLQAGDTQQQKALLDGLGHWGLIHIEGHELSKELLDCFYNEFQSFCNRSTEEKSNYASADVWFQRGWTPPDTEKAVIAGGQPDFKECYFAAPISIKEDLRIEYPEICAHNIWPNDEHGESMKKVYIALGKAVHDIGIILLEGCASALDLPKTTFTDLIEGGPHVTRALRYLPLTQSQLTQDIKWGEEHTDFNLLTLLPGGRFITDDSNPFTPQANSGLFLRAKGTKEFPQGRRVKGGAPAGCMIAQVGQQLEILTGGKFLATPHEVLPPNQTKISRMSIAHFMHMHPHRRLTPLSGFRTPDTIADYRPAVLAGNYSLKTLVDIGLAPQESLHALGYRHYNRLEKQRTFIK